MLYSHDITFKDGSIITSDMLSLMYNIPKGILNKLFIDYSNGIISGLNINVNSSNDIILTAGIYKYENKLYTLSKDITFSNCNGEPFKTGQKYILGITNMEDYNYNHDMSILTHRLILDIYTQPNSEYIPLLTFIGNPELPETLDEVFERKPVNMFQFKTSTFSGGIYNSYIFKLVYDKISHKKNKHPLDYAIMVEIDNKRVISKNTIIDYIKEENPNKNIPIDDKDLLKSFSEAIDNLTFEVHATSIESSSIDDSFKKQEENSYIM